LDRSNVKAIGDLDTWLAERNLNGHWNLADQERVEFKPFIWKWADISVGLEMATELVGVHEAGRRTIQLRNPGMPGRMSNSIHMSIQSVLAGETAEAHRHTAAAIRYVIQGTEGAATVVNGEPLPMQTGDLVTTPSWSWHDHYNDSDQPVIWLDVLDVRLAAMAKMMQEPYTTPQQARDKPVGFASKTLGHVRPSWLKPEETTPAFRYPWTETEDILRALRESEVEPDPYDGYHLTYAHPVHGGPTLPTFACELQELPSKLTTRDHRHLSTTIYQAFRGSGVTVVDGQRLEWSQGDIFIVPPWSWHHHENPTDSDAILFSVDDWPTFQSLALYREEGR
jgi:1-hydroxy-2-naphthoate dioxygenase